MCAQRGLKVFLLLKQQIRGLLVPPQVSAFVLFVLVFVLLY